MKILVVIVARFANEAHALQVYSDEAGWYGREEYPGAAAFSDFLSAVVLAASKVDVVCIDECALGIAVLDHLKPRTKAKVLWSHRMRPLGLSFAP